MKTFITPTIGLEIHIELSTKSKMFCGCPSNHFGKKANTQTCPVCLGLPGALPVPNQKAVQWTQLLGLALNCNVELTSKFDRKHYFYPDLPKGFQISQYDEPLCVGGSLKTKDGIVGVTRVHLEEDTGKLLHKKIDGINATLVDFNRSGVALVEIVTEPDIRSAQQAKEFAKKLQQITRSLNISDCDMEKGSMRLEANISLGKDLGYKVEVKNINSFKFLERAINYELKRQEKVLVSGRKIKQETRGWDEKENKTVSQRSKETAADYRYFPEPDIPPMRFTKSDINKLKSLLPELPDTVKRELLDMGIRTDYVDILFLDTAKVDFVKSLKEISRSDKLDFDDLVSMYVNKRPEDKWKTSKDLVKQYLIIKKSVVKEEDVEAWVEKVIKENPKVVADYKSGKGAAISVLIGITMKESNGKADAKVVTKLLTEKLK